ncbi:unnamed protein product [Menidia menidia]|uniref:(Atlantic silverside) hypothetical protein n=1 Tax=Menidia menidia TaxID=238744 RepID=A0A8S4BX18_9TELE|nr:unnamed protein product [Menidia menidia]
MLLSDVSGLSAAGGQKEELRVVGENITLPDSILENGFLSINGRIIALVRKGEFGIEDHSYVDRVHWNKQTGLFTITDLQISDSGDYNINFNMEPVYSFSLWLRVFGASPTFALRFKLCCFCLWSSSSFCLQHSAVTSDLSPPNRLSAAGGEKMEELRAVVGGNITLTDSILQRGFLLFNGSNMAFVTKGEFDIEDKTYENRVHWNKQTGLFSITDLQTSDSGVYKLESKTEFVLSSYQLRVFERVPAPAVRRLNSSSEGCWLLCWVGRNTSLWWQRGQQVLTHSSSASSLLLPVDTRDFSSSLSCVASSPAENKTVQVSGATSCALNPTGDPENRHTPDKRYGNQKPGPGTRTRLQPMHRSVEKRPLTDPEEEQPHPVLHLRSAPYARTSRRSGTETVCSPPLLAASGSVCPTLFLPSEGREPKL